ncbi:MAG: dihydroneopterin aldolase [Candidatus Dormibacteraeota bacterium]|nr:dihydroneopterin aldolase [Candidatus Dormibacteraeota bacterium]
MPTKPSNKAGKPTGRLILEGLEGFAYHGNNPAETKLGQSFIVDLEVLTDTQRAAAKDRIEDTVNYPTLEKVARRVLEGPPRHLLETVAEEIAAALLREPGVLEVTVRVTKRPPLAHLRAFTVEITRPLG